MTEFPIDVLYKLYKAKDGEAIDNGYVRLSGDFNSEHFAPEVNEKGQVSFELVYELRFKGPHHGLFHAPCTVRKISSIEGPDHKYWCHEPFTRANENRETYMAYYCYPYKRTFTVMARQDGECWAG